MITISYPIMFLCFLLINLISMTNSLRYDCCSELLSGIGPRGCEIPYRNSTTSKTYYCLTVAEDCDSCSIGFNITSASCFQCCVGYPSIEEVDDSTCGTPYGYVTATSWSKFVLLYCLCLPYVSPF